MSPQLCIACGLHPTHWRGFCATCCTIMGLPWRQRITMGNRWDRQRAIEALRTHYASINKFRTKENRG